MTSTGLNQAVAALRNGGVIAYPTESCYGLGCDPMNGAAVDRIVQLKRRPLTHGLLLVASDPLQLYKYLSSEADQYMQAPLASWPGPYTWILPAADTAPDWLTGGRDGIAVRISANQSVQQLCAEYGDAMVSTSANPHGLPAATTHEQTQAYFPSGLDAIVRGETDGHSKPSQIQDARTGTILRSS